MRSLSTYSTTTSTKELPPSSLSLSPPSTPVPQQQRSPWHSPVPYLFGGLAAMLGLIAFALLILACSYWRLSGRLEDDENGDQQRDLENGKESGDCAEKAVKVYEEKILVIMAGDEKPTFLAAPSTIRTMSFADKNERSEQSKEAKTESSSEKTVEEEEESGTNHHQTETHREDPTKPVS